MPQTRLAPSLKWSVCCFMFQKHNLISQLSGRQASQTDVQPAQASIVPTGKQLQHAAAYGSRVMRTTRPNMPRLACVQAGAGVEITSTRRLHYPLGPRRSGVRVKSNAYVSRSPVNFPLFFLYRPTGTSKIQLLVLLSLFAKALCSLFRSFTVASSAPPFFTIES